MAGERLEDRHGDTGDYLFKLLFIWISIGVAIISLRRGKWIPNFGAILRVLVLGFFSITVIAYGIKHGVAGFSVSDMSPTRAVFFGLVPLLLFNYVGFELQNGAAEEMENPQRDVPLSVLRSGITGVLMYVVPIFCILVVLPASKVTSIGGFIDAVTLTFHGVYGGAAHALLVVMTLCFIGALVTSGAVWMIGSDRIQAVAAYDGAFIPFFGVFNRKLGTPVRVNVLSGITASVFSIVAHLPVEELEHRGCVHGRARHRHLDHADLVPVDLPRGPAAAVHASARPPAVPAPVGNGRDLGLDDSRHRLDRARVVGGRLPRHARAAVRRRLRVQGQLGGHTGDLRGADARARWSSIVLVGIAGYWFGSGIRAQVADIALETEYAPT